MDNESRVVGWGGSEHVGVLSIENFPAAVRVVRVSRETRADNKMVPLTAIYSSDCIRLFTAIDGTAVSACECMNVLWR